MKLNTTIKSMVVAVAGATSVASSSVHAASGQLGMYFGPAGKVAVSYDGTFEFRVVNRSETEDGWFVITSETKAGRVLEPGTEFRTSQEIHNVSANDFAIVQIRFKPGEHRTPLRVCIEEREQDGSVPDAIALRFCARVVAYTGISPE